MRSRSTSYQRETCSSSPEHVRPARRPNGFGAARRGARVTRGAPIGRRGESDAGEPRDGREPRVPLEGTLRHPSVPSGVPASCGGQRPRGRGDRGGRPIACLRASPPARARAFVGPRDAARAPASNGRRRHRARPARGRRPIADGRRSRARISRRRVEAKTRTRARGGGSAGGFGAVRLRRHGTGGAAGGRERMKQVVWQDDHGMELTHVRVRAEVRAARLFPPSPLPHARGAWERTHRPGRSHPPPPNPPSPRSEPSDSDTDERAGRDGGPNGACCVVQ